MKAIHNEAFYYFPNWKVVLYPKDTEKWKQFTTHWFGLTWLKKLFCIPKILKNESNSQLDRGMKEEFFCCFVSQRYWKMKAIHNKRAFISITRKVVLYPKDTEKWKQFTTTNLDFINAYQLFCIPKILKNESNSQLQFFFLCIKISCFVSQRYWKMKAIHNYPRSCLELFLVVLYPKDTEKWKQFTTAGGIYLLYKRLFCIPKILKNESNSQLDYSNFHKILSCFVSQRYWKMKAIHNWNNFL